MSQGLEKQLENVLLDLTKDHQNSDPIDLDRQLQKLHATQGDLEKQKTDLQQKMIKLKNSQNDYRQLYDTAPAAFFILNNQGKILDVNFAGTALIGVGKSHLLNSDLAQYVAPEFMDAFFYHRRWTLESNVRQACELKLVKGDCSTFFARLQAYIQTIITDISDQKQMEDALEVAKTKAADAGKVKGEFLSKMSHEFRTPLHHIIGFTELALEDGSGILNATQKEYLGTVVQSSQHLLILVKDILDLSKLEAGTLEFEPTEVRLKTLLENGIAEFEQKAVKRGMTLLKNFEGVPDTIRADETMLKQIISHLLSNAFKFTQDGGEIRLSARMVDCIVRSGRRCGDAKDLKIIQECIKTNNMRGAQVSKCAEVAVSDTGIGLNAEDQKYIFEPFKQVDESLNRRTHGAGIGLSLAKNLVELQGGKIWVESAGQNKGSVFRFILPI
jgi:PAS domain S-box-containing protein